MNQILDSVKPWLNVLPGTGEIEQLWFAVILLGGIVGLWLAYKLVRAVLFVLGMPVRSRARAREAVQNQKILQAIDYIDSSREEDGAGPENTGVAGRPPLAKVQIFVDYANFDKNWIDNAYNILGEGNQKVRLDWNKLTDVVMREVGSAMSSWQPGLVYRGTFVQASILPERFTTPRSYKLPKALALNYYIYAKDDDLVRSKLDGKEYIAKKMHPAHVFLKYMMRKLPGYHVNISRRVIERNFDGTPVVITSKSGTQYIKSGEKAVDSRVIADMTAGAMNDGYDIAVLLGSDTDFLPVIDTIQKGYNKPVIHVGFERGGHQVRSACWSHVVIDRALVRELKEPAKVRPPASNAVGTVAAKLASPVEQETVKQVVQLFASATTEGTQAVPLAPVANAVAGEAGGILTVPVTAVTDQEAK